MDCLGTLAVLALGFNKRQQERLARKFELTDEQGSGDPVHVFQALHEGCHGHEPLVRAISRDLGNRFGEVSRKVRASTLSELGALATDFPLPFLWATLNDARDEARAHGRRCLHELFLRALAGSRPVEDNAEIREAHQALVLENKRLKAKIEGLERASQRPPRESGPSEAVPHTVPHQAHLSAQQSAQMAGKLEREIRKLSYGLKKEQERAAGLEERLRYMEGLRNGSTGDGVPWIDEGCMGLDDCPCLPAAPEATSPSPEPEAVVCQCRRSCPDHEGCTRTCPLDNLKVAILGGTEKTLPAYRCMVEELGGDCLYHDGCTSHGMDRLKRIVCQADIVVCITSMNSHGAVHVAKSVCKRTGKKLLLTKETGTRSLKELLLNTA
jgi:hypothetical protein